MFFVPLIASAAATTTSHLAAYAIGGFLAGKAYSDAKKRRRSQELEQAYQKARQQAEEDRLEYHKKFFYEKGKADAQN